MSPDAAKCILVPVLFVATITAAAQSPATIDIPGYRLLVLQYIEGDPSRALAALAARPTGSTRPIIETRALGWTPKMMHAAAMLETDAAFTANGVLKTRLSNAQLWLERAHKSLPPEQRDVFWPQWSTVVGRKLIWMKIFGLADPFLKAACDVFDDDAGVHLAYGLARESASFAWDGSLALGMSRGETNSVRTDALSDARTALERALKLDSGSVEARVRLAHVYLLLKDDRGAAPLLEQTLTLSAPPFYRYLAALMLGDVQARRGQLQPALDLYLVARRLMPSAQSAYIAQANALRGAGQTDAAAAVLREMLTRVPHDDDPWMQYPMGFDLAATQLDPLRALVRKQ